MSVRGFMKISISIVFFLFCSFIFCLPCVAQETQAEGKSVASSPAEKELKDANGPSKKETQQLVIRVKTKQKVDFSGTVTNVDLEAATLSIRSQGKTISFDMSKAILMGYRSTGEIKKGDEVSVGYTPLGLQIQKGTFAITHREPVSPKVTPQETVPQKVTHQEPAARKATAKVDATKPQKIVPIRMKDNKNPTSFEDIDNNKDGKITPIELCVLMPGLTLQTFKEYDRNGDGCLNKSEFNAVKRNR
jgi:hypothetical protein